MDVSIEIDDAALPSIQRYLATQIRASTDASGAGRTTPIYSGVEDFFRQTMLGMVQNLVLGFPPEEGN